MVKDIYKENNVNIWYRFSVGFCLKPEFYSKPSFIAEVKFASTIPIEKGTKREPQ